MLWLQGIMGAGLASSLAGNRILNGCLLAPSHRHTHTTTPHVLSLPAPYFDSSHTLYYSELHQSSSAMCVRAPTGHTVEHLDDFSSLGLWPSHLSSAPALPSTQWLQRQQGREPSIYQGVSLLMRRCVVAVFFNLKIIISK